MKTMSTPSPQLSNSPLRAASMREETVKHPQSPFTQANTNPLPGEKSNNTVDTPENWDEAWFANYE